MTSAIQTLLVTLQEAEADLRAAAAGKTKASATRARKALQEIRGLAQEARNEVLAVSKGEREATPVADTVRFPTTEVAEGE